MTTTNEQAMQHLADAKDKLRTASPAEADYRRGVLNGMAGAYYGIGLITTAQFLDITNPAEVPA